MVRASLAYLIDFELGLGLISFKTRVSDGLGLGAYTVVG